MKNRIKKATALLTVASVICLSACSENAVEEVTTAAISETASTVETTTKPVKTTAASTTAKPVEATKKSPARVVEVPYEDGLKAVFTFNEKGLLVSSENCPWGADNDYYTYDEQNRITEIQHALWDGTIDEGCERKVYTYNENGNVTKCIVYTGPKEKLVRFRVYDFEYNAKGLLTKETHSAGGNGNVIYTAVYEYDESGHLIKAVLESYDTVDETFYEYDENGNLILMNWIDSDGNDHITEYEYDAEGNIIREASEGRVLNYEYKNGLLIKKTAQDGTSVEYKYYDNNNIVAVNSAEEINIYAIPEVMGNYDNLPC